MPGRGGAAACGRYRSNQRLGEGGGEARAPARPWWRVPGRSAAPRPRTSVRAALAAARRRRPGEGACVTGAERAAATASFCVLALVEQDEVARVQGRQEHVAEDHRQLVDVEGVEQGDDASPERDVPEHRGHDDLLQLLRVEPLDDEARAEQQVAEQPEHRPPPRVGVQPGEETPEERLQEAPRVVHRSLHFRCRSCSQRTPRASRRPLSARSSVPYLDVPAVRGWWRTGTCVTV